ncbi:MAG: threonylcarbamoyl-AMP synthase [Candidatus Omnitrophica bacterium]|nr:threonylcarbamoyl-AMP synthase [Candidatus Omnitrophota bacterium]
MHTKIIKTSAHNFDPEVIKEAAGILKKGGIVGFPTETVYGLAADYNNKAAVDRLYEIKKRPKDKPFTIHIAHKEKILEFVDGLDETAKRLIDRFWPGPLTIIVKTRNGEPLGFRMPSNKLALKLIEESRLTIVAPSANISGHPDSVDAFSVVRDFEGLIDMVIDTGRTETETSSTVVDISSLRPRILREGFIAEQIKTALFEDKKITNILIVCAGNSCRSPMAEALLKRDLEKEGFNIKSAGIIAVNDLPGSADMADVMKKYAGINMSGFSTHKLTKELADWANIILVMDETQKDFISDTMPQAKAKTYLFKEYASLKTSNMNIQDPMGKPFFAYEQAYKQIEEAADKITEKLKKE